MIRGVIFDLDGLLNDSEVVSWKIYQDLVRPYGKEFSLADYARNYSGKTERGNMEQLIDEFQLDFDVEEGMRGEKILEKQYIEAGIPAKPGAVELVKWLKTNGYRTAIASSSTIARARKMTRSYGIWEDFDAFVFCEDISHPKPHPEVFSLAADRLHLFPEECLVLEDSQAGILSASAAGIPVICIPDLKQPEEAVASKCAAVLPDLLSVRKWLQETSPQKPGS